MKTTILATAFAALSTFSAMPAIAAPEQYVLDASHSQILFNYSHLGFSTTYGMFAGFDGEITFDAEDPAASAVNVAFPISLMNTGWTERDAHFLSPELFDPEGDKSTVTFVSTGIEVTGDSTANITGDLTLNGITKEVVLDTVLNQQGAHPMAQKDWLGFNATTTLLRSDFGVGIFAPAVSDEVEVMISIEAMKAE